MCRSMVDIQSVAAEIRRGKKKRKIEEDRKKLQGKNIMAPLLHRAAIKNGDAQKKRSGREVRGVSTEAGGQSVIGKICDG